MPKISEERREERRQEIITAAIRCFLRTGYQRTSMNDIIAESGLSAGAIYGYFTSKQNLIRSVAQWVLEKRQAELSSTGRSHALSPTEIAQVLIVGLRDNAPTGMILQIWAEATVNDELHELVQDLFSRVRATVQGELERWASVHPELVSDDPVVWAERSAPVLVSLIVGSVIQQVLIDDFDDEVYLSALPGIVGSHDSRISR